jgi:fatty-acyl-CoA synthase
MRMIGLGFGGDGWMSLDEVAAAAGGRSPSDAGNDAAPLLLVYTSGTTGRAKGAILTQGAVAANAENAIAAHDLVPADRVLTMLPLFHVGGLNIQTLPALKSGATVLLHPRFNAGEALAAIMRDRPSVVLLVPAVMKAMIAHSDWPRTDLTSLRLAMAGSSVVPVELIKAWHARGVPVGQVYGATETGPVSIVLKGADAMRKEGSTGKPALHCAARIVDADGRDVAPGARGEILLRGPHVTSGYWHDEAATREAFVDGWFRTGDIGHQDADGDYWIDDRKNDLIIAGGENIYPAELEAVLEEHPAIAEAAVVARADARWGEVPVAIVVRRAGVTLDADQVKALFAGRLARFKHPHDVLFVDSLPRNVMGKVQRFALRAMLARG